MNEIIVEETGLPLKFPDPAEEAYARAQEFRQLSSERRFQEIAALIAFGLQMVHASPRRALIEQRWQAQEEHWQSLQQELMTEHGT